MAIDYSKLIGKRSKLIPIVPTSDLYLANLARDCADGHRFARIFRDTWRQIPLGDRRRMVKHWHTDERMDSGWSHPRISRRMERERFPISRSDYIASIQLIAGWNKEYIYPHYLPDDAEHCGAFVTVAAMGHKLWFHAPSVARMPDNVVANLIAKGLAHVYQWATEPELFDDPDDPGNTEYLEGDANQKVESWGFELYSIEE